MLNRLVVVVCSLTLLATASLTLSVLVLRPPRLNHGLWIIESAVFAAQSAGTLLAVTTTRRRRLTRRAVLVGGTVLMVAGAWWLGDALSVRHFEGYAVVLSSLVGVQGLLTVLRLSQFDERPAVSQPRLG